MKENMQYGLPPCKDVTTKKVGSSVCLFPFAFALLQCRTWLAAPSSMAAGSSRFLARGLAPHALGQGGRACRRGCCGGRSRLYMRRPRRHHQAQPKQRHPRNRAPPHPSWAARASPSRRGDDLVGVAEWADACAHYQVQLKNFSSDDFRGFSVDHCFSLMGFRSLPPTESLDGAGRAVTTSWVSVHKNDDGRRE
jgi:hypothetical protein